MCHSFIHVIHALNNNSPVFLLITIIITIIIMASSKHDKQREEKGEEEDYIDPNYIHPHNYRTKGNNKNSSSLNKSDTVITNKQNNSNGNNNYNSNDYDEDERELGSINNRRRSSSPIRSPPTPNDDMSLLNSMSFSSYSNLESPATYNVFVGT